jgi:hypothetical protein
MAAPKPFEVKIWTSSHGTDRHHFPASLQKAFFSNTHPLRDSLITLPLLNAIPGRETKDQFVAEFKQDFDNIPSDVRRVSVILMGDNDIRSNDYVGASRIESNIQRIIDFHHDSPHCLIICGLLPSPVSWTHTSFLFHRVSNRLYSKVDSLNKSSGQPHVAFLKVLNIFLDGKGFIEEQKFFDSDRIHLNPQGAFQLANHLITSILSTVQSF